MDPLPATICVADRYPAGPYSPLLGESGTTRTSPAQARILVVDDEKLLADTTAAVLSRAGFDAKAAYDGFAAMEAMASFHPHYLLTDIMMPGMNGVDLAIATTTAHPGTKIMLFSGQAGIVAILEEAKAKGFEFPLLAKPVHPAKLIEGIRELKDN